MTADTLDYVRKVGRLLPSTEQARERHRVREANQDRGITNPLMCAVWCHWQNDPACVAYVARVEARVQRG